MTPTGNRGRVLGVAAGALAVLGVEAAQGTATAAPAANATVQLSPAPLGMNIPPWNVLYTNTNTSSGSTLQRPPYLGYVFTGNLTQPGAKLTALSLPSGLSSSVLAFQSVLRNGKTAVLLINTRTSAQQTVSLRSSLAGKLTKVSSTAANQNSFGTRTTTVAATAPAVSSGLVPCAESMTLLKEN